jgi:hypothetical protein
LPTRSNDELRQEVAALTTTLQGLGDKLVAVRRGHEAQIKALADDTRKARRHTVWTIIISVLIALVASIGGNNYAVTHCFLSGKLGGLQHSALCNTLFPGYNSATDLNRAEVRKFNQLLREIPKNIKENRQQDRRLNHLEGKH